VVEPGALVGHGIGGGIGEGPVKILDAPDPRQVNDGDVLVVTFADPAWTPLFMRASAVVMEVGGTMCHAAVVARELGIPAVFAVRDAKTRLVDGERVRVDGDAGRVIRLTEGR
jgi:pyruvate,water dikinase